MNVPRRRRLLSGLTPRSSTTLFSLAVSDGALIIWKLDETSGNFVNAILPGTSDLTAISANLTRGVAGVSGPDLLGVLGATTNGTGAPSYGHAEGTMPSVSGNKTFSMEMVVKTPVNKDGNLFMHPGGGGNETLGFSTTAATGNVNAEIQVSGQAFNTQSLGTGGVGGLNWALFHHIVATWDGTTFRGYRNGVAIFGTAIGGGNLGIQEVGGAATGAAVLGYVQFNNNNVAATIEFVAIYTAVVLSQAQVTAHFNASGCTGV